MKKNTGNKKRNPANTKEQKYNRAQNFTRRNKHAKNPIANTLKKHRDWCRKPNDRAYKSYGAKGRRVATELTYTKDGPTNEAIIEKVIERIGEKPKPYKKYHLHVDWAATGGVMTLGNIAWVTVEDNTRQQSTNIRLNNGTELRPQALAVGLNPATANARARKGRAEDFVLNPQLRQDIDFNWQRKKHEAIAELITSGKIYVTKDGQLYIIPEIGEPYLRKASLEKTGYHSITLMIHGKSTRVQLSHVVLIQYAGLPSQDEVGSYRVWNADHIDGDKENNRPDNLCWLLVSINSGLKKIGNGTNNNSQFVSALVESGKAKMTGESISPHPDDIVAQREAKAAELRRLSDAWKDCVQSGWLDIPDTSFIEKVADSNQHIPSHLLIRFALAPGNKPKVVGEDISIECNTKGRRYWLSTLDWNCRGQLRFVFFSDEVVNYLESNYPAKEIAHILDELPSNALLEKQPTSLRSYFLSHGSKEGAADYLKREFIEEQLSKTLLCAAPSVIRSLYRIEMNDTPNPLLLSVGARSTELSVRCSQCGGPTESAPIKSIVRSKRLGAGRLCERCNAMSRARNGHLSYSARV